MQMEVDKRYTFFGCAFVFTCAVLIHELIHVPIQTSAWHNPGKYQDIAPSLIKTHPSENNNNNKKQRASTHFSQNHNFLLLYPATELSS